MLRDRHVALGITGSIAAYKAADLASKLTQAGARVDVVLTPAATQFVSPLTFQSVSGRPAFSHSRPSGNSGARTRAPMYGNAIANPQSKETRTED